MTNGSPNWTEGYVPDTGEWSAAFAGKVDATGGSATGLAINGGTVTGTIANGGTVAVELAGPWDVATLTTGGSLVLTGIPAIGAASLLGNAGTVSASPTVVAIGTGLTLTGTVLGAEPSALIRTIAFPLGTVASPLQMNIILSQAGTLLANGGAFQSYIPVNPAAIWTGSLNLIQAGTLSNLGSIVVSTAGSVTAPSFAARSAAAGTVVQLAGSTDATFANASFSLQFQVS